MREIINVQLGGCGTQVGCKFWEAISNEHGIDPTTGDFAGASDLQLERVGVYYNERAAGQYTPRSVMVDLDPETMDKVRSSACGKIFKSENFVSGERGAGNNWATGHYTDGADFVDSIMDVVRHEVESCDCAQGFQLVHSLGGGTGSGLGALLLSRLREEYPDRALVTFSVFPTKMDAGSRSVRAYNAILSMNHLAELTDTTFCIDNEALWSTCFQSLNLRTPIYADLNHLVSMVLSGVTTSFRFPGQPNSDLRTLSTNMVPLPRMHFLSPAIAPLTTKESKSNPPLTAAELTEQLFDAKNTMVSFEPRTVQYLRLAAIFRGQISVKDAVAEMTEISTKVRRNFVDGAPEQVQTSVCEIPPRELKTSGVLVANTNAISQMFQRILTPFSTMFGRKAYLHWYTGEGMDEAEFREAESNINELISGYSESRDAIAGNRLA